MYTDDEIRGKQLLARAAGLSGAELLDDVEAVKKDCNGIGAAWMPDRLRDLLGERSSLTSTTAGTRSAAESSRAGGRTGSFCGTASRWRATAAGSASHGR